MDRSSAELALLQCCGSTRWAASMAAARPFGDVDALTRTGDAIWSRLDSRDWLEAFAAHPRIGAAGRTISAWSRQEQSGVHEGVRDRLVALNRAYESRFGHIFIVCATGRGGDDMLAELERRLRNRPEEELREASEEQRKIMRLRLAKLFA